MSDIAESENMGSRIKKLRMSLHMTQEEFGKQLSTARNTIANYEIGKRNPSNATIELICTKFHVNEVWLRTGEDGDGNMFTSIEQDDRYSLALGKLSASENRFLQNALITMAETEPEKLKIIEEFMKNCLGIK